MKKEYTLEKIDERKKDIVKRVNEIYDIYGQDSDEKSREFTELYDLHWLLTQLEEEESELNEQEFWDKFKHIDDDITKWMYSERKQMNIKIKVSHPDYTCEFDGNTKEEVRQEILEYYKEVMIPELDFNIDVYKLMKLYKKYFWEYIDGIYNIYINDNLISNITELNNIK